MMMYTNNFEFYFSPIYFIVYILDMNKINTIKNSLEKLNNYKEFEIIEKSNDSIILKDEVNTHLLNLVKIITKGKGGGYLYLVKDCLGNSFILKIFSNKSNNIKNSLNEISKQIDFSHIFTKEYSENNYLPCPMIYLYGKLNGYNSFSKNNLVNAGFILMENISTSIVNEDLDTYFTRICSSGGIDKSEYKDIMIQLFYIITKMKENTLKIYFSHCDLHTENIFLTKKPKKLVLDFGHIGGKKYLVTGRVLKIIDFGEAFEYKQFHNEKSYKTCRYNRSLSKVTADTMEKCYTRKGKFLKGKFIKTRKIGKILFDRAKGTKKNYGDEDLKFFINILNIFDIKLKSLRDIISNIEILSNHISLSPSYYNTNKNVTKDFQKFGLNVSKNSKENIKNILRKIYIILTYV